MIDRATLPLTQANEEIPAGRRFEVLGQNFNLWPDEIVLGYYNVVVTSQPLTGALLKLVEKTNTRLVFEAVESRVISSVHQWNVFGSPFEPERSLLSYEVI